MFCSNMANLEVGYVTIWYQSFWFNTRPVWAKDQCEFGKFIIVEF
jgi:hypothetical protein